MLVLTRKINQSITIGDDIKLTVLAIDGDRVSLGVSAPRDVKIFRSELLEETRTLNRESSTVGIEALKGLKNKIDNK